jgi:hypothetical protein
VRGRKECSWGGIASTTAARVRRRTAAVGMETMLIVVMVKKKKKTKTKTKMEMEVEMWMMKL